MDDKDFHQKLAITLAGNPEFIKKAYETYENKAIWYCVKEQLNATLRNIEIPVPKDK